MRRVRFVLLIVIILILCTLVSKRWTGEKNLQPFSMERLLKTSILPVGETMYVWGGGWNEDDNGAGTEAVTMGVCSRWKSYADKQTSNYDYRDTRYQIHDGLDCSGYIGWLVYNVFHTVNGETGYVMGASKMAETFASYGWGYMTQGACLPGDICSMEGHVWMSLGTCDDGSVLLVHASPPGVRICGTCLLDGTDSEAVALADFLMRKYYPDWYRRYPECRVGYFYLTDSVKMRWFTDRGSASAHLQQMDAYEIVQYLYGEDLQRISAYGNDK